PHALGGPPVGPVAGAGGGGSGGATAASAAPHLPQKRRFSATAAPQFGHVIGSPFRLAPHAGSVVDALLGNDAGVVRVLDLAHLGDGIRHVDERGRCVATGRDHTHLFRPLANGGHDVVGVDP